MDRNIGELVAAITSGQVHLYGEIVRRFDDRVRAAIRRRIVDPATVDDLVQVTFYRAFKSLGKLEDSRNLEGWLVTIAKNCATDHLRKQTRLAESVFQEPHFDHVADKQKKNEGWIWEEVAQLSPSHAEVLAMRYRLSLSSEEICERLNLSESTIRGRLYEARKALKCNLKKKGLFP